MSGMGSWAVVVSGALMSLHVLGINLAPLLTVGTYSSLEDLDFYTVLQVLHFAAGALLPLQFSFNLH